MTIRKQQQICRRLLLQGLGAASCVGLPFLRSKTGLAQDGKAPVRLLLVALQHGWGRTDSTPFATGSETDFQLADYMSPFNAIIQHGVFIAGLRGTFWGNAHDVSYTNILTASTPADEHRSSRTRFPFPEPLGPSLDSFLGDRLNVPVLRLSARYRSWGATYHPMCFDSEIRELPFFLSPTAAYDAVTGGLITRQSADQRTRGNLLLRRQSLFQLLGRDGERLRARLSGDERFRFDHYLASLDSLQTRLTMTQPTIAVPVPNPPGMDLNFAAEVDSFLETIRFAFQADTHRIAVLGLGQGVDDYQWTNSAGITQVGNTFSNARFFISTEETRRSHFILKSSFSFISSFNRDGVQPSSSANSFWVLLAGIRNSSRMNSPHKHAIKFLPVSFGCELCFGLQPPQLSWGRISPPPHKKNH